MSVTHVERGADGNARHAAVSPGPGVSESVRTLLRECVVTYEMLECLVMLVEEPQPFSVAAVSARLDIAPPRVERTLHGLREGGLVEIFPTAQGDVCVYGPRDAPRGRAAETLVQEYRDHVVEIIKIITANSIQRMHNRAIERFSDAFLIGRDQDPER